MQNVPGTWEVLVEDNIWKIFDENNQLIATIANTRDAETKARLIALCPYMLTALKNLVELIGDEDLPDNGELSGAAICDMVRAAVQMAESG